MLKRNKGEKITVSARVEDKIYILKQGARAVANDPVTDVAFLVFCRSLDNQGNLLERKNTKQTYF